MSRHRDERRVALGRAVAACRRALVGDRKQKGGGDIGAQLEAPYGFDPKTGLPAAMEGMAHLRSWQVSTAENLREWHAHLMSTAAGGDAERARTAYDQMRYELGYTSLHRLAALRMAEERGIVKECVRRGRESDGFRLFLQLAGDSGLGDHEEAYAFFLARLYDELARDLPAVFDRRLAASLIAPRPKALGEVLAGLNAPEIASLWRDDETLGWIFEDYNDADERKEMREHDAPRNARELAVRNQFFTPRWVVEFLTDNTVGRLWYDLSGGETEIGESCQYLLKPAERAERGCRDPRDIKVLDPACGSGHFLLYVYDLLEIVYREVWEGRHHRRPEGKALWEEFPEEAAFRREIPRLILANNLYGVDIDPRCIQEAGVALWLRAHRSWEKLGVRAKDRPRLTGVNLVCAQALGDTPGMRDKLREKLKPAILGGLVDTLFQQVAEMGVLFRVESAIRDTVESVKKEYLLWKREAANRDLFGEVMGPKQTTLEEFAKLRDEGGEEEFWRDADKLVLRALEAVAEEAEDKEAYKSRLFTEGVRQELEFFDLCRIKYDVVLMNPPFSEPSESTEKVLAQAYPNGRGGLDTMFCERGLEMLAPGGRVGAVTKRGWFALPTLAGFRQDMLGKKGTIEAAADIGYGVLKAKVETVAIVVRAGGNLDEPGTWVRLVKTSQKAEMLRRAVAGEDRHPVSVVAARFFLSLPDMVCGYWMSERLSQLYNSSNTVTHLADAVVGVQTSDDFRFLRLGWEVEASRLGLSHVWARFAKGGDSRWFYDDVHLAIRWEGGGKEIVAWGRGRPQNIDHWGRRGVTWPLCTNLRMSPRVLPAGCAFGHKGPSALTGNVLTRPALLATLGSAPAYLLLSIRFQTADDSPNSISKSYEVGLIRDLPWPALAEPQAKRLSLLAAEAVELTRLGQIEDDDSGETVVAYALPPALLPLPDGTRPLSLEVATRARVAAREERVARLAAIQAEIDAIVADAYGFTERDRQVMDEELEPPLALLPGADPLDEALFRTAYLTKEGLDGDRLPGGLDAEMDVRVEHRRKKQVRLRSEATLSRVFQAPPALISAERRRLALLRPEDCERVAADIVSYAVGVAFGRWDIRLWAHPEWIPTFADPFDPMPPCPLGQLVNAEGFPATEDRIASEDWLATRGHPTDLPQGPYASFDIHARAYPVAVAWGGLLVDDILDDALPRRPEQGFLARFEAVLEHFFGAARSDWEQDLAEALGVEALADWLRAPGGFFADHLTRYSKSRRQAPIYWPISTSSGGLTLWVYGPRFDKATLALLVNCLRSDAETRRDERDAIAKLPAPTPTQLARLELLRTAIQEREALRAEIEDVLRWGYEPHPDDGFAITAAPLHFAFRLAKWRDFLKTTWNDLAAGAYDWAHLAMRHHPDAVLSACKTERSIALAHGREDLLGDGAEAQKKPRARKAAVKTPAQTTIAAVDAVERAPAGNEE